MLPQKELVNYWVIDFNLAFTSWFVLVMLFIFYSIDPRFIISSNFLSLVPLSLISISPCIFYIFSRISEHTLDSSPSFSMSRKACRFLLLSQSQRRLRYQMDFLLYLISLTQSLCCYQKAYIILVYFLVSNIQSKMALRLAESEKGQRDSSWWQKTIFQRTDLEMPRSWGICFSIQAQWWLISNIYPFSSLVLSVCSIDQNLLPLLVRVSKALRLASTGLPLNALNFKRVSPIIQVCPIILGSITKFLPLSQEGGRAPVVMYLSTSMIVYIMGILTVFPEPFLPQMRVSGVQNSIFQSSRGEQLLNPAMPRAYSTDIQIIIIDWAVNVARADKQKTSHRNKEGAICNYVIQIQFIAELLFAMDQHPLNDSQQYPIESRYKSIESDDTRNPTTNKKNHSGQFQRSSPHHQRRIPRIAQELQPIQEKLNEMESMKYQYMKMGKYKKAQKMHQSIRRTKSLLGQHQIDNIVSKQKKEKRSITVAHKQEMHYLNHLWSEYFYRLKEREADILHSFKLTQKQQIQSARQKLQKRCKSLRESREIVQLKKKEMHYFSYHKFKELSDVRKQLKHATLRQEENRSQLISHWAQLQENRLSLSQSKKYKALISRLQEYRQDKQKVYRRQQKRLKQKYKNVLAQLEHDQTLQLYYARRLISFDDEVNF